jgi:rod shape-determining protein MreD
MKIWIITIGIIFLAILETSFFPIIFFNKAEVNIMLVLVVVLTVVFGFSNIWVWSVFSGLILDAFSYVPFGTNVIAFLLFCYTVSFFSRRLLLGEKTGGIFVGILLVSLMTIFYSFWIIWVQSDFYFLAIFKSFSKILNNSLWNIIWNLFSFLILLIIFKKINKKYFRRSNMLIVR